MALSHILHKYEINFRNVCNTLPGLVFYTRTATGDDIVCVVKTFLWDTEDKNL